MQRDLIIKKFIIKTKVLVKAAIVITIILGLILPSSALVVNTVRPPSEDSISIQIQNYRSFTPRNGKLIGENIKVSGWDDDILPSICKDLDGNTVVTFTNDPGELGITWSNTPYDPLYWYGWIISFCIGMYYDTALIQGPDPDDYNGLMGVYMDMSDELAGYYFIPDIESDPVLWDYCTWDSPAPEPKYSCISDMVVYQDLYHPVICGPFNFYIYSYNDIQGCPICFHTDVRGDWDGGLGYFDGQSLEKTAPASNPDIVDLGDRFHTVIQYTNTTTGPHIVWKKIVPVEEPDYEFTPYQDTIAVGEYPSIAAYDNGSNGIVAIAYVDNYVVKCIYSHDDGETWATTTIDSGTHPDIYANDEILYCAYINGGNLFLSKSDDGGVTWSNSEQINEVNGTVVEEENYVDLHTSGVVWVDERGDDYDIYYSFFNLNPPNTPAITGDTKGKAGIIYEYNFTATDPDGDDIYYYIDWGDGSNSSWLGPYESGMAISAEHSWSEGTYEILVKAKDIHDAESEWSEPLPLEIGTFPTVFLLGLIADVKNYSAEYVQFNAVLLIMWPSEDLVYTSGTFVIQQGFLGLLGGPVILASGNAGII